MRSLCPRLTASASLLLIVALGGGAVQDGRLTAASPPPGGVPPPESPRSQGSPATAAPDVQRAPPQAAPHVQRSPASLGSPAEVEPAARVLSQLTRERAALELVDQAARRALAQAARRVAAMHAFIEGAGAAAEFGEFSRSYRPGAEQITFREATDAALDHLSIRPINPTTTNLSALEQAVETATSAAHQSFDHLNAVRRSAETLATFLQRSGRIAAYQMWAAEHPASKAERPALLSDPAQAAAAWDERALQVGWDRAQRARANEWPAVVEPGAAVAHGPYASSWWNSYADPYYDLVGSPAAYAGMAPPPESTGANSWETPGYSRQRTPVYPELGPNVVPAFGMFPSGATGGGAFGPGVGAR